MINIRKFLYSINNLKSILLFAFLIVIPWSIFSELLKYNQLVFYDAYNIRVFFSNIIFCLFVIIYFRSLVLSVFVFYSFILLHFISYFYLRKGILFSDLKDLDELIYALGNFNSYIIYFFIIILFGVIIFINIRFFKIKIFLLQIMLTIFFYCSFTYPHSFQKVSHSRVSSHQNHMHLNLLFYFGKFYRS